MAGGLQGGLQIRGGQEQNLVSFRSRSTSPPRRVPYSELTCACVLCISRLWFNEPEKKDVTHTITVDIRFVNTGSCALCSLPLSDCPLLPPCVRRHPLLALKEQIGKTIGKELNQFKLKRGPEVLVSQIIRSCQLSCCLTHC